MTVLTERMKSAVSTASKACWWRKCLRYLEERLVADDRTEHVQDEGSLRIAVGVEHVARLVVSIGDDRPDVAGPRLPEVGVQLVLVIDRALFVPLLVPEVQVVGVGAEAFVHPGVGPAPERNQVAPPLVGELVGHDADRREVGLVLRVDHDAVRHCRHRGALGAAAGRDRHLVVLLPGVVVAEGPVEELDHLRRLAVGRQRLLLVLRVDPVVDREALVPVPDHDVGRSREKDEVGRMRPLLGVVPGDGPRGRVLGDAQQTAVGGHLEARLHGGDDLVGHLVVRIVEAREPVVDVIGPGIREDQPGVVRGLRHEPEADLRVLSAVVTGERPRLAELQRARQMDGQLSGRLLELQRLAPVAHHPGDRELLGVENARRETFGEGGQRDRGFPLERLPIQVEPYRNPVVERVVRAAPLGLKGLG